MKLIPAQTLASLAELLDISFVGPADHPVTGINEIHRVEAGDLVFCDHPKYYDKALQSAASTVLINAKVDCPEGKGLLVSEDPFSDYNKLTRHFNPTQLGQAVQADDALIAPDAHVAPTASIGAGVEIGAGSVIHPGVVLYQGVRIGTGVTIHAGSVIGADAFYYQKRGQGFAKMHTCGGVVIENDVEIGAMCTIDRGVSADTVIGQGSKLDNQVHVGHDTIVGKRCLFAAQVGIAGCVVVEDDVTLWGQVGVKSDATIGAGAVVMGQSGITKDVPPGKTYFGTPAQEASAKFRELAGLRKLLRDS